MLSYQSTGGGRSPLPPLPWIRHWVSVSIGVIYGGTRGTGTPTHFLDWVPLIFQDTGEEFTAVNRGDLRRLNLYTITVFSRGSAPDPAIMQMAHISSQYTQGRYSLRSPLLNWYPIFTPKLRPQC